MKSSRIPSLVFGAVAGTPRDELGANHLGGKRVIAPLRDLDGWVVFSDYPDLHCSSCMLFKDIQMALKDCCPTCGVQVGPYCVGWDEEKRSPKRELRASLMCSSLPPAILCEREVEWLSLIQAVFDSLNARARPVELLETASMEVE